VVWFCKLFVSITTSANIMARTSKTSLCSTHRSAVVVQGTKPCALNVECCHSYYEAV